MNISVKSEYALQAMFDLAAQPPGEPIKIAEVARRQKIPQKFLELILAGLKQGGFVESRRGAEGGYLLWRGRAESDHGRRSAALRGGRQARTNARAGRRLSPTCGNAWIRPSSAIVDHTTFAELVREWTDNHNRLRAQLGDLN